MLSKCKDLPKKGVPNAFNTNKRGPKKIWVPKEEEGDSCGLFEK